VKKSICFMLGAVACCVAMSASAQSVSTGKTRAEVRAELVQLQKAGYNPAADETQYPRNIQAALARVEATQVAQQAASSSYGGVADGSSDASALHKPHHAMNGTNAARAAQDDIPGLGPIYAHS